MAFIGDGTEGLYHLKGRDGDALTNAHRGCIDDGHLIGIEQDALLFTGQFDARNRPEAKAAGVIGQRLAACRHGNMGHAGIDGIHDDFPQGHVAHALVVPVVNRPVGDVDRTRVVIDIADVPFPRIQGGSGHEGLEGRPRFVDVDDSPVLVSFFISLTVIIGIIRRPAGHSQYLTGLGIHDDNGCTLRMTAGHDAVQALFGDVLDGTVQSQADGPFLVGQDPFQG